MAVVARATHSVPHLVRVAVLTPRILPNLEAQVRVRAHAPPPVLVRDGQWSLRVPPSCMLTICVSAWCLLDSRPHQRRKPGCHHSAPHYSPPAIHQSTGLIWRHVDVCCPVLVIALSL